MANSDLKGYKWGWTVLCEMFVDVYWSANTFYGIILGKLQSVFIVFDSSEIAHHTHRDDHLLIDSLLIQNCYKYVFHAFDSFNDKKGEIG